MVTFNDIATDAYIKNGLMAPGETLDANLGAYAVREANRLLDQWNVQAAFVFTTQIILFNILSRPITVNGVSQYWFTIGPGPQSGVPLQPDFVGVRPVALIRANLMLTTISPNVRVPLQILDARQWSDETVPNLSTAPYPNKIYYDASFDGNGNARIYLHPVPNTTSNQLELFITNQVARFATVNDPFSMPIGYEDAFMLTLAERTIEGFRAIPPTLAQAAARARAAIRAINSQSPKMSTTDTGMPGRLRGQGAGNVFNGWPANLAN